MKGVINILVTTENLKRNYDYTEIHPIAFKSFGSAEYELLCEGYRETAELYVYEWQEEEIKKTAKLVYVSIER